ncbi:hypothetical protein [Anaeromyxobacter terrae]|uniref:hypothetical protein n=1 Tax=Anaeromyxobacter terrae TaxID=2925406 RepID=UPI001F5680E6|nr:hypothetical protein [Anaeromyxobacter sp. SG22]
MRKRIALAALAAALAGCSDPKVDPPASPLDTSTIAAFCDSMLSVYAGKFQSCYHVTPAAAAAELDASYCRAQQAFADAGRLSYDAAQAARCLAEMQTASCDQLWFWDDPGAPSCASVFAGHTSSGSACAVSEECAGGRCTAWTADCSGTCVAWLAAGEACDADPSGCGPGLACDAAQVPARCAAPIYAGAGQPCGAFGCDVGLWCDAGTCRAKTSTGSCTGGAEACVAGSICMAAGPVDALCVPLVGVGDACGTTALCGPGSHCATSGRCEADPGPGQPCAVSLWTDGCAASWCDAGTCRGYVAAGGACTDPAQCGPLSCVSGACVDDRAACVP